jgi:hypothetical protein
MASKIKVDTLETADGTGSITLSNQFSGMTTASLPSSVVTEDAAGNVGIGVTPESWDSDYTALQIGNWSALWGKDTSKNTFLTNNVYRDSGGYKYLGTDIATNYSQASDGAHKFYVAPSGAADSAISWTTAMTIDNSGDVFVGTSSSFANSSTRLEVLSESSGTDALACKVLGTNQNAISFYQNGYSSPRGQITVGTSSVAYNTSSDYRLKENIVPMSGSIDRLKELKPSRFNFIADASKTVDGFLAHEAQAIVPECVTGTKDGMMMEKYEVTPAVKDDDDNVITEAVMGERSVPDMQGIDQAKLVPLLTSALQDAIAKIEQLESRISALEVN